MILEIACNDIGSVEHAYLNGADRVELCANLPEGGVTPSFGTMIVSKTFPIPIYAMIRPRGGDFKYTRNEMEVIKADIESAQEAGIDGIVFGALNNQGLVDVKLCEKVKNWWGKPMTFHRAFDVCKDLTSSLEMIIELGFERVLTSGGKSNAVDGKQEINELVIQAAGRISILAGAGITSGNIHEIAEIADLEGVHTTAKFTGNRGTMPFSDRLESNPLEIRAIRTILNEMHG